MYICQPVPTVPQNKENITKLAVSTKKDERDLVLIGDSMVKHTEVDRLANSCPGKFKDSKKFISPPMKDSSTLVKSLDITPKSYVIHLGTNDLKSATAAECSEIMSDLCDKILKTTKETLF